jgi:hypothetical protein
MLVCVAAFGAGYFGAMASQKIKNGSDNAKASVTENIEELIEPTTEIVLIRQYSKTNNINIKRLQPDSNMIGQNIDYIRESYPDWEIGGYSKEKISLYKIIDSYSPGTYLLTSVMQDNEEVLAVYTYDIDGNSVLYGTYDTPVSMLPAEEIVKIRAGIAVSGEDALNSLLENYAE